jgi:hypothetical protein
MNQQTYIEKMIKIKAGINTKICQVPYVDNQKLNMITHLSLSLSLSMCSLCDLTLCRDKKKCPEKWLNANEIKLS